MRVSPETLRFYVVPANGVPALPIPSGTELSSGRIHVGGYTRVRGVASITTGVPLDMRITQIAQDGTAPPSTGCVDMIQFQVPVDTNNILAGIDSYCFSIAIFAPYVRVTYEFGGDADFFAAHHEAVPF